MYELHIDGQRDETQPRVVVLESKLFKHHLLHWTYPGPPASVTFQVRQSCTGQCCAINYNCRNLQDTNQRKQINQRNQMYH